MDISNIKDSYSFRVEEFKRCKWNLIQEFSDLKEADEFAQQIALRTLEMVRVIRHDYTNINLYCYAR